MSHQQPQVDELLRPKLTGSGIESYVRIEARVACEKQIISISSYKQFSDAS